MKWVLTISLFTLVESAQWVCLHPLLLELINSSTGRAFRLGLHDRLREALPRRAVRYAEDEGVVQRINVRRNELARFGVRTSEQMHSRFKNVKLESCGDETRGVG